MQLRKHTPLLLVAALGLVACVDDRVQPLPPAAAPSWSASSLSVPATLNATRSFAGIEMEPVVRHVVVFKGKAPADFEAKVEALGGAVALNHSIGIAVVTGLDDDAAAQLQVDVKADFVEEHPFFELIEPAAVSAPRPVQLTAAAAPLAAGAPNITSDPTGALLYGEQWNLHQIHAEAAWAAGRVGSSNVTVAILDTGIDYLLPDLAGRVDLSRSVSFEPFDDLITSIFFPGRHPSTDLHYHGTNVATQVASNAWAYAGVTSRATLMSVKVCSAFGGCEGVVEGLLYAIDNGADVINMSLDRIHIPSFFATYCDAVHVICVSATRMGDAPSSYTNYGRSAIDVAAPGGEVDEWVYSLCPQTSLAFFCEDGYYSLGVIGTSQATPHVAGLAALAVEDVGRSPARVRAYIRNSADVIPGNGGNSPYYGKGRINVARAVGLK